MSLQFRIADQILTVKDTGQKTESIVHKFDAFLNLLSEDKYYFQRDAIRESIRFMISDNYPNLERLACENWNAKPAIQQRHESLRAYLDKMPFKQKKSVSIDLATGTGKSYAMYGLAAVALAEGLVDRVLVLCPSLTIEDGLLEKFTALAGNSELTMIMRELGAAITTPCIKRGNQTVQRGDICIENIHAVYENAGSSIADSFRGQGARTLVLNDEAHHLFSPPDKGLKEWMKFLQNNDYIFTYIANFTGTPYVEDEYFPDVIYRYGLKQAIEKQIVKIPNYKLEETFTQHDWQKTYSIHQENQKQYGKQLKPISIVVTQEIARCVEVWRELIDFLVRKEKITPEEAEKKAIWVTSGIPSGSNAKDRVEAAYNARNDKDSPEKRRRENLQALKVVDEPTSPVEWIVSVSMLTEGWDVKNVFQIVPHESRAFNSKLLIAQVLGRGLRVPPGLPDQPLVTINNHEKWTVEIANLLKEILEVENTLSWGYEPKRSNYLIPLYNLNYESVQKTVEIKRETAKEPDVKFIPQAKKTTEYSTFSETGTLAVEIEHKDFYEIDAAAKLIRLFLREKDEKLAKIWSKKRLQEFIVSKLGEAGQETGYLSKENLLRLQQGFGPMFRELDKEHPRMSMEAKRLEQIDLQKIPRQSFSESLLKEHGAVYYSSESIPQFSGHEVHLWEQYQKFCKQVKDYGDDASEPAKEIASRIHQMDLRGFKVPWNILFVSHEPERKFTDLLFANAELFEAFVKMPNQGGYSFPYSYKPAKAAKTHVTNDNFNPDYFLRLQSSYDIFVVEIKDEGDDSNRNKAKYRDGKKHFEILNFRLKELNEKWYYHFFFLSSDDYTKFFDAVREQRFKGWKSGLMQELEDN